MHPSTFFQHDNGIAMRGIVRRLEWVDTAAKLVILARFARNARPYTSGTMLTMIRACRSSVWCLGLLLLAEAPVSADVWERSADGKLSLYRDLDHFQRSRMADGWRPPSLSVLRSRRDELAPIIERFANYYGVNASIVHAIIEVESAYDARAVSKAGAMGLMQLMPATAERFGVQDPLDPEQNIEAGIRYLRVLFDEFDDTKLVLAAYNAGEKAVRRYGNHVPPFAETRAYIQRVQVVMGLQSIE